MAFQFDTSGTVPVQGHIGVWTWPDLSPFVQGYIEALLQGVAVAGWTDEALKVRNLIGRAAAFSDLAPETLARIMEDCAKFVPHFGRRYYANTQHDGGLYWKGSAAGQWCKPLTPYLGDDGKVYLRDALQDQKEGRP